jgi:hypothetical protein
MTTTHPLESGWLSDTPVDDSILRRFLFNQADVNDTIARAIAGRVDRTSAVALSDSGLPVPYLNQATLFRPLRGDDDEVLDEVAAFYRNGSPALLLSAWPTPDLSRRGWMLVGHPMFVVRGATPVSSYDELPKPGVSVRLARSAQDLALMERLLVDGYPIPELADLPPNRALGAALIGGPVAHRVGYLAGAPVATGASLAAHGVVNLCLASTLPAARRQGVWQAMVNARCADAPNLPAVAFTSDYSRPGFVRMGFLPIQRFTLWVVT